MILRQLLQDRWLDSFGATTVERELIAPTAERMVQWFVPFAKNGLPLGFRSRSMCSMRDPPDSYRPLYLQTLPNSLHPLPGETVRRANPPLSHPCSAPGARRRSPTTTVPLGTSATALVRTLSIIWVNQGSIGARLPCVFARRARRANRAQSTAHH